MRQKLGFFISEEGQPLSREQFRYRSDMAHFQASLVQDPPHMDIPENFYGGTAQAVTSGNSLTETIKTIKHNLSYTPEVLVYFYCVTYDGSAVDPRAGLYSPDVLIFSGSLGTAADSIYAEVDNTNLYIKHHTENYLFPGTFTSDANKFLIRMKYYILSIDSHVASYNTRGY